jgi:hypothetical protein
LVCVESEEPIITLVERNNFSDLVCCESFLLLVTYLAVGEVKDGEGSRGTANHYVGSAVLVGYTENDIKLVLQLAVFDD